jgi:hypothetical protein
VGAPNGLRRVNNNMRILWNDVNTIKQIINESKTKTEVLNKMGYTAVSSWNRRKLTEFISKNEINVEHLRQRNVATIDRTLDEIFCEHSLVSQPTVKKYFIKSLGIVKCKCFICDISTWNGEKLSLQLDHINGCNNDNRIDNLRLLCPNCHSITPTFGGKNKK